MNPNAAAFAFILQQRRDLSTNQLAGNADTAPQSNQCRGHSPRPTTSNVAGLNQNALYTAGVHQQQRHNSPQETQSNSYGRNDFVQNHQLPAYSQPVNQQHTSQYGWQPPHQQPSWQQQQQFQQQQQQLPSTYRGAVYGSSSSYLQSQTSSFQQGAHDSNIYSSTNNYSDYQQQYQYQYQSQPSFGVTNNIASTLSGVAGSDTTFLVKNNSRPFLNSNATGTTKSSDSSIGNCNSSSSSSSQPFNEPAQIFYCEGCDKEFTQKTAYDAHCANHETCRHPGCNFSGTKKVVIAHFHGSHGLYSGEGYKMIEVEGSTKKFRVLLGVSPEEIEKWRSDRKKNFPTAENTKKKMETKEELRKAGGLIVENVRKRKRDEGGLTCKDDSKNSQSSQATANEVANKIIIGDDDNKVEVTEREGKGDDKPRKRPCVFFVKGTCKQGDSCTYSHDFEVKICNFFVKSGRCTRGNRCTFAHDKDERMKFLEDRKKSVDNGASPGGSKITEDGDTAIKVGEPKRRKAKVVEKVHAREENNDDDLRARAQKKKGQLFLPKPFSGGNRGTLLRNLLLQEVAEEENILLQCLRLIVRNNYLQPATS